MIIEKHSVRRTDLSILSSFGGLPKRDKKYLGSIDPNDRKLLEAVISKYIVAELAAWESRNPGIRDRVKFSLWYYLHHQPWDPEMIFGMDEPVLAEPEVVLDYYRMAWTVLFGGLEVSMPEPTDENYIVFRD
jgi:hypothetical protein